MVVKKETSRAKKTTSASASVAEPLEFDGDDSPESASSFEEVVERVKQREMSPVRKAASEKQQREVLEAAGASTVEGVIRATGELRVKINAALDTLTSALTEETRRLQQHGEAVRVRQEQLAELANIQIAADTLADLIARHDQEKQRFDQMMAESKAAWDAERQRFAAAIDEDKKQQKKLWEREQEEYEYTRRIEREREQAEDNAKRQAALAALAEEKARTEKELVEREQALAMREQELVELRAKVAGFPAELHEAVTRIEKETRAAVEEKAQFQAELKAKDVEANERVAKLRVQTLEQLAKEQAARIEILQQEVRESADKVQAIAVKVIEGASGAAVSARSGDFQIQQNKP